MKALQILLMNRRAQKEKVHSLFDGNFKP